MKMNEGFLYTLLFLVHIKSFISHFALVLSWKFHLYPLILYNYTPIQTQSLLNFLSFHSPLFLLIRGRMVIVSQKKNSLENSRIFVLDSSPAAKHFLSPRRNRAKPTRNATSPPRRGEVSSSPRRSLNFQLHQNSTHFKATIQPTQHTTQFKLKQ